MITKSLISMIYEAASIQRWNDHIRPWVGFTELDKQAHKMFYAYVLAKCEGDGVDYHKLIEGGIFEFFHRIIVTDIKPPIYHKLVKEKGNQLNEWVFTQLKDVLSPLNDGFFERMVEYYRNPEYAKLEKEILKAAHYQATYFEFQVIYPLNKETYGIEAVKREMHQGLAGCDTFPGYKYYMGSPYLKEFLLLLGKLRYQQRWSKASRVPNTFVMGHMLVVAILSYFSSLEAGACKRRSVNNFLGGLFHDMPEVLTRDIVSPVKSGVDGLDDIIKSIEEEQVESTIYPLLPQSWHNEIRYFIQDEFVSKIKENGEVLFVTSDDICEKYNSDEFCPIDGEIIRCCDHLSAYMEAYLSLEYGIRPRALISGYMNLRSAYENKKVAGIDYGKIFKYFEIDN
ncbi:MAG: HD domain-containing protein [Clostridia bacterium]|nr:HD domain-containing protein [Clostridia bacterium]